MGGTERILLVENNADDCRLISLVLREQVPHCQVDAVRNAASFADSLGRGDFSAALVSADLAWAESGQVLASLRQHHPECRLFMMVDGPLWPPAEPLATTEILPRTSGGIFMFAERLRSVANSQPENLVKEAAPGERASETTVSDLAVRALGAAEGPERSAKEMEELAYALSHDLLGTVHLVGQYARLLHDGYQHQLDADAKRYLDHLTSGSRRLTDMVEAVLGYLRASQSDSDPVSVDMGAVVHDAAQHLHAVIEDVGARIHWISLPTLTVNRQQLVQLFQNLLANAVKFRGEEPPRVYISAVEDAKEWKFAIKDNGIGINTDNQKRVFSLFHRLGTPDQSPGSGIGLAMCKRIVERHGGRIWVESRPGEGSTFIFTIPKSRQ